MARRTTRPTEAQLEYCRWLGINVGVNDTRYEITQKITQALGKVASELLRQTSIKPGHVVRTNYFGSEPEVVVLLKIGVERTSVKLLGSGRVRNISTVQYPKDAPPSLAIVDVFPPPQNWQHAFIVTLEGGRIDAKYDPRLRRQFLQLVEKELEPHERQTLVEYGEYWRIDAVDRLRGRFLEKNDL